MDRRYRYWRRRILISSMVGYALFYFLRKNLSVAMPGMQASLGIGKAELGLVLTLNGLVYGVSKLANGILGDRANPRVFMAFGLLCCVAVNIGFGLGSSLWSLGFFIYGPQCLVGVIVANLATKRATATAIGLTDLLGYSSTIVSGWGMGSLVDTLGWNAGYGLLVAAAVIAAVLFAIAWSASATAGTSATGAHK